VEGVGWVEEEEDDDEEEEHRGGEVADDAELLTVATLLLTLTLTLSFILLLTLLMIWSFTLTLFSRFVTCNPSTSTMTEARFRIGLKNFLNGHEKSRKISYGF